MSPRMLLNVKDLSLSFPDKSLFKSLALSLHAGEIVALTGPNGCGKSTLLETLLAREESCQPTAESVGLRRTGSITLPPALRLTHLPQRPSEVWLQQSLEELSPKEIARESEYCSQLGVIPAQEREVARSDGQLQKASLACVLATDADLYLLDEPTNLLMIEP